MLKSQYEAFPYPTNTSSTGGYRELVNLVKLLRLDCGYHLQGKRILDAGTGTGLRLLELAAAFPDNEYVGIDYSENSIACAERARNAFSGAPVSFRVGDIMAADQQGGPFDVILCMGVLHHLQRPAEAIARLSRLLTASGVLIFYVYGEYGSGERMRRKRLLGHLHGQDQVGQKIESAKRLGFTDFPYGWAVQDPTDVDPMIVDAYVNHYEVLYTLESIAKLVSNSFTACVPYGFTLERNGLLVESRLNARFVMPVARTDPKGKLNSPDLEEVYAKLPKRQQLLVLEDLYAPAGYTMLAHNGGFLGEISRPERLTSNTWQ
ncbi:class I SAM-dependent methyltransferase [Bradyrhizobium acaciae]|uniref:class I SAM-dependent methyltransferase n=1 Tax=Bradyrhizobium acaciae TaxID=2683706 RepID=UPI001E5FD1C0|nr:class I SAM-dependent methyltransferase [Bradyrhizobium acaciae]MCC8980141.1 class I SAM-dependent methyltransferase [Bradyrhizobium acaciae]